MAEATLKAIRPTSVVQKREMIIELQETLQMIWNSLPWRTIKKAVKKFPR